MKRLLLPLLAALALPSAVNAETWWLIMRGGTNQSVINHNWEIPTNSEQECEASKVKALNKENWDGNNARLWMTAICLKGK